MTRIILIDDEPLARSIVSEYLRSIPDTLIVDECNDGFEGVKSILQHKPDLIFLDVQMPKINGFEMLELLETPPSVIFTTAFDEFALKAFETHAVDYLLKPFSRERFEKAWSKWIQSRTSELPRKEVTLPNPEERNRIVVRESGNIRIIPVQDIIYLEAYDDYVKIKTPTEILLKKKTLASYESSLDPAEFIRIHRSYLLAVREITRIEPVDKESHLAILRNGDKLPVSKTGYQKIKDTLRI